MTRRRDLLDRVNLVDVIAQELGPDAVRGLHRDHGGCICDPTPGHEERNASFSVYRRNGRLYWKRHSDVNGAGGDAFDFLMRLGYSPARALDTLARMAGMGVNSCQPVRARRVSEWDVLKPAQVALARCAPLNPDEASRAGKYAMPLRLQDPASHDLRARGLGEWCGLSVGRLSRDYRRRDGKLLARAGALAFFVRGPDGQNWGLKVRNLNPGDELGAAGLSRYIYRISRHGAPAWCSPEYGSGSSVLLIEGELNGAAACRALQMVGAHVDVQGLAGASGVPFLTGVEGKTVYVYADADAPGVACVNRVAALALRVGAREVRVLAPLPAGDFCDLAGQTGIAALRAALFDRLDASEQWQPSTTRRTLLPEDDSVQHGRNIHWRSDTAEQTWGGTDSSGWGTGDRGGW